MGGSEGPDCQLPAEPGAQPQVPFTAARAWAKALAVAVATAVATAVELAAAEPPARVGREI